MKKFRIYELSSGRWYPTQYEVFVDVARGQNPILAAQMQHKDRRHGYQWTVGPI